MPDDNTLQWEAGRGAVFDVHGTTGYIHRGGGDEIGSICL